MRTIYDSLPQSPLSSFYLPSYAESQALHSIHQQRDVGLSNDLLFDRRAAIVGQSVDRLRRVEAFMDVYASESQAYDTDDEVSADDVM